ncbi:MAG TPA: NAD-dependent epimerase/dehydratase family protein, partial [Cyclobacteriaceae bacterium]|nr:NAD-dependent epimerase/dehydratase family protein [Cyclobacteriaceae bacterium]
MKILVTGGTGLLGKNLIERLISESHEVKALVRKSGALKDFKIDEINGNLRNIQEWKQALQGCDAVIHCAAKVEFWGKWEDYYRDNTLSTLELLEAADALGVKRFVYISSESVLQHKKDLIDIDENEPYPTEP